MNSNQIIITSEIELEIQRELEQDREDQFVLEQMMIESDQHNKQHLSGDKKV